MGSSIAVNLSSWVNNQLELGLVKGTATEGDPLSYPKGDQSFHLLMKGIGALVVEGYWIGREDVPPSNDVVEITLVRTGDSFDEVEAGLRTVTGDLQTIRLHDTPAVAGGRVAFTY